MPSKQKPVNPIIQNYLNDDSVPLEKRQFAISEIDKGVPDEKIATAISQQYGDKYLPESRIDDNGKELSIKEFEQKKTKRAGQNFQQAGKGGDKQSYKDNIKKEMLQRMFGAPISEKLSGIKEGFTDAIDRTAEDWDQAKDNAKGGNVGRGFLDALAAGGNLVSSPISAAMGGLKPNIENVIQDVQKVPGSKTISKYASKGASYIPDSIKDAGTDALEATGLFAAAPATSVLKTASNLVKTPAKIAASGVGKIGGALSSGVKNTANYLVKKGTALSDDTLNLLKNEPTLYKAAKEGKITDQSLADDVLQALDQKSSELSTTGGKYEKIRTSTKTAPVPKQSVLNLLEKRGIKLKGDGKLDFKGSNIATQADKTAVKSALDEIMGYADNIGGNDYLNLRSKLDDYINYESQVSVKGEEIVKNLRKEIDNSAKSNFEGLADLDAAYSPLIKEFKLLKKDFFRPDGGLKDNALSKITNLSKKGKEQILGRLEEASPGISDKIRAYSALEDVKYAASGRPVGAYLTAGLVSGGLTGNVPLIIAGILSNPVTAANLIMKYGQAMKISSNVLKSIKNKMANGTKLNPFESKTVTKILQQVDSKLSKPAAGVAAGNEAVDLLDLNE